MVSGVVIARILGPEALGLWAILQLIPGYAEAFGRLKFDISAVYFLGKKKAQLGEMIFTLNLLALITSSIIIAIFLFKFDWFYSHLFKNSITDMRHLALGILLVIPLQFLNTNYNYIHLTLSKIKRYINVSFSRR